MIERATNIPKLERIDLSFLDGSEGPPTSRRNVLHLPFMLTQNTTTTQGLRAHNVAQTIDAIREISAHGISRKSLENIKTLLTELASRTELFPWEHFPLGDGAAPRIYRLSEDADGRFAMYASVGAFGKAQPPHNHTTWAVISGVYGEEHNVLYRRSDDRSAAGEGQLERVDQITVKRGNAVAMMPNDFHTICVTGEVNSLHLHAYGRSLEQLPKRITFENESGGRYQVFGPPKVYEPVTE
jgi:predicted metal-dependent enzyme (double-stranded beta helix superfamily)